MTIRLLIVDDQLLVCEGLRAILSTVPEIEVVGVANDGAAVALTEIVSELSRSATEKTEKRNIERIARAWTIPLHRLINYLNLI